MSVEIPLGRRLATAITWPLAMAWTSFHYIWRILPVHRSEEAGTVPADLPPPLPDEVSLDDIQQPDAASGPLLHRIYSGTIVGTDCEPERLIGILAADPDRVSPWQIARFRKTRGAAGQLAVGDEFLVQMPGPWDGPVRAVEVRPDGFRFATLSGHLEAGQIEWRAWNDGQLRFAVESWARGGDRLSAFVHDRLRMAKEVQLYMWTSVVERVPRLVGGHLLDGVHVHTRRVPPDAFDPKPA